MAIKNTKRKEEDKNFFPFYKVSRVAFIPFCTATHPTVIKIRKLIDDFWFDLRAEEEEKQRPLSDRRIREYRREFDKIVELVAEKLDVKRKVAKTLVYSRGLTSPLLIYLRGNRKWLKAYRKRKRRN